MEINTITLNNFRNHTYLFLKFEKGINFIYGKNGVGKTNVLEAIMFLSILKSFRGCENAKLLKKDCQYAAQIGCSITEGNMIRNIQVTITENNTKLLLNGKKVLKYSEFCKIVNVILFEPKDVFLFKGLPKDRRFFLDVNIAKKSTPYFDYLSKYNKVLKDRNDALKQPNPDLDLINSYTDLLISFSGPLVSYRELYVQELNNIIGKIAKVLLSSNCTLEIVYKPFCHYDNSFKNNVKEMFEKNLSIDLKTKVTTIGIHREDFILKYNGENIAISGSQGENRLVAIVVKLAPYFLIEDKDKRPIVVLDDVMSELDEKHQLNLINFLKKLNQTIITGTKPNIKNIKSFELI